MTTSSSLLTSIKLLKVVEAYRQDGYDNFNGFACYRVFLTLQKPIVRMGMTTSNSHDAPVARAVVEAYRQDGYDNFFVAMGTDYFVVVEAYRQDGYDNFHNPVLSLLFVGVVEAYRQDGYDNFS